VNELTGSELVRRAVLFQKPERVPRELPDPWGNDFLWAWADAEPDWKPSFPGEDEWGCGWERDPAGKTMGQVKYHPLADYSRLESHRFPNYDVPERYARAAEHIAQNTQRRFVLAGAPISFIHRLEYLRGHEAAWTDPFDHPEELNALLTRITDIAIDSLNHFARIGVEGIISADDWGLQDRPMVSPKVFRTHFKPHYARVYRHARKLGMLCFLHSCGHISSLLDDMIEAGVQVIQMDQQENMGVEELARRFGGRVCFWCPVDIQQTMVRGTEQEIADYACRLIEAFGCYHGGFIAKWYPSPEAVGHTPEKIRAMAEAFVRRGVYTSEGDLATPAHAK
jgi:hypothetical protein